MEDAPAPAYKQLTNPIEGSQLRIAPERNGRMAAFMWRIFAEGNEAYACGRLGADAARISFHHSGQIHQHLGRGKKQLLRRAMSISEGTWLHQIQWRFLIGADVLFPPPPQFKKKKDRAFLLNVPLDCMLILDLLIAAHASIDQPPTPREFAEVGVLWHTKLAAGHHVILLAQVRGMDETNRQVLQNMLYERNLHIPIDPLPPTPPYIELHRVDWSEQGGNVIVIVPMGHESYQTPTGEK